MEHALTLPPGAKLAPQREALTQPVLQRIFAHWTSARGDRFAPSRADIDPRSLGSDLSHVALIDVLGGGSDYRVRLVGTHIVNGYGFDHTGKLISELPGGKLRDLLFKQYRLVLDTRAPVSYGPVNSIAAGRDVLITEHIDFPMSSDGTNIDKLLAAVVVKPQITWGPLSL